MALLPRSRRLRRRERARRRRFLAGAIVTIILLAGSLVHLSRVPPPARAEAREADLRTADLITMSTRPAEDAEPGEGLVYNYSIIPGGARTPDALRKAIEADPVVRAHYANFDLSKVRVVRLNEPRVAHVSYRIGDRVFWTRRPLLLKADETLLTDGVHYARTRCGNQLAAVPGPTSSAEPNPEALDTPLPPLRGARVFPSVTLPTPGGGPSTGGAGVPGMALGGGVLSGPMPRTGLPPAGVRSTATDPTLVGSSEGLSVPPESHVSTDGGSGPFVPRIVIDDPHDPSSPDDPRTPQVPEPGLTLLVLSGGAFWARRFRRLRRPA